MNRWSTPGDGPRLAAAGLEAAGVRDAKRLYSSNIVEPQTRQLHDQGGNAADSVIARYRTQALALLGIDVGPAAHSWAMVEDKLEFITKLP